jgi:hypothetical protein
MIRQVVPDAQLKASKMCALVNRHIFQTPQVLTLHGKAGMRSTNICKQATIEGGSRIRHGVHRCD